MKDNIYVGCVHPVSGEWEVLPFHPDSFNGRAATRSGIGFRDKETAEKYMSDCRFLAKQHLEAEKKNWGLTMFIEPYKKN